jgi:hypothetical protein
MCNINFNYNNNIVFSNNILMFVYVNLSKYIKLSYVHKITPTYYYVRRHAGLHKRYGYGTQHSSIIIIVDKKITYRI